MSTQFSISAKQSAARKLYFFSVLLIFAAEIVIPVLDKILEGENIGMFVKVLPRLGFYKFPFAVLLNYLFAALAAGITLLLYRQSFARKFFGIIFLIPFFWNFVLQFLLIFQRSTDHVLNEFLATINLGFVASTRYYDFYSDQSFLLLRVLLFVRGICLDTALILGVVALFKGFSRSSTQSFEHPSNLLESVSTGHFASPNSSANTGPTWTVRVPGSMDQVTDTATLKMWARSGVIRPDSFIVDNSNQVTYQAKQIPGVFSSKSYSTALLLSFFLGYLGVDRFYLGQTGLGIAKLLTFGGCGIWSLIDFILIAMRKVTDSEGNPLA